MAAKLSRLLIILGVILIIILALRQFGDSKLALLTTFSGLVVLILALLFAPEPPSGESHHSWFLRMIYESLRTSAVLHVLAGVIWAIVLILGIRELQPVPAQSTPFYISYHTFHGQAVNVLLEGHVNEITEKTLDGQPMIVQTDVLDYLRKMQVVREASEWDLNVIVERIRNGSTRADTVSPPSLTREISKFAVELETSRTELPSANAIYDIVARNPDWRLGPLYSGLIDYDERTIGNGYLSGLSFGRYGNLEDARSIIQSDLEMSTKYGPRSLFSEYARTSLNHLRVYEELFGKQLPRDFFLLRTEFDGHGGTYIRYYPPSVRLKVALIRNLGTAPQRLEAFEVVSDSGSGIQPSSNGVGGRTRRIEFPPLWLQPNDVVLIPLAIEMVTKGRFASDGDVRDEQSRLIKAVEGADFEWFETNGDAPPGTRTSTSISRDSLLEILNRGVFDPDSSRYRAGPSDSLSFVVSDGRRFRVRPEVRENVLVYRDENIGSCPYIAVRRMDGSWQMVGTILTRFSSPSRENWDTLDLPAFDGSVRIIEKDAETTMVDFIGIIVQGRDGNWRSVPARDPKLAVADGQYLVVNRRDTISVDFEDESVRNQPLGAVKLVSKGFFLPLPGNPNRTTPPPLPSFRSSGSIP